VERPALADFAVQEKNAIVVFAIYSKSTVYRKESYHSQKSDNAILSEYIFRLLRRYHQLLIRIETHNTQMYGKLLFNMKNA